MWLIHTVLVCSYDEQSPLACTCTDHALIMHWSCRSPPSWPIRSPPSHAHFLWTNQSYHVIWWLFWTNQGLTFQRGIHARTPPGKLNTEWYDLDESNRKLSKWAPVHIITTICTKWLQGLLVPSKTLGNYFVLVPWYVGAQVVPIYMLCPWGQTLNELWSRGGVLGSPGKPAPPYFLFSGIS